MSSFSFAWCMIKTTKFFVWTDSMLQYHNRLSSSNSCDAEKEEKEHFECCASFLINFLLLSQITEQYFRNQLTCLMDETNNFHILLCRFRSLYARGNNLTVQNLSIIFSACANLDWLCDRRIFFLVTFHAFYYTVWNEPDTPGLTLPERGKKSIFRCKKGRHNQRTLLNKLWKSTFNFIVFFASVSPLCFMACDKCTENFISCNLIKLKYSAVKVLALMKSGSKSGSRTHN